MTFQPATAFRILDQTLLRAAALLVPRRMRREWSKEGQWGVCAGREACGPLHGIQWDAEKEILSFCAGAFGDGLCLRKEAIRSWQQDLRSRQHALPKLLQQALPKLLPASRASNSASQ